MNKVVLITGSTRGIGRNIANKLAKNGYNIIITGKSIKNNPDLPGTIYDVEKEIKEKYNVKVMAEQLDVRNYRQSEYVINKCIKNFGKIDVLVNNAGALWWDDILNTSFVKYNLINDINAKSSFMLSQLCLPHMIQNDYGHIIMHSPPLPDPRDIDIYKNKTAYMISKFGMTMTSMGISQEYKNFNIASNTIWPSTAIESAAVKKNNLGNEKLWRKPDIISDSILNMLKEDPLDFTGNQLIDEEYLRMKGVTNFDKYQCVPGEEPPKLIDLFNSKN